MFLRVGVVSRLFSGSSLLQSRNAHGMLRGAPARLSLDGGKRLPALSLFFAKLGTQRGKRTPIPHFESNGIPDSGGSFTNNPLSVLCRMNCCEGSEEGGAHEK